MTVRYFAAARAAADAESETVTLRPGATVAELVERLAVRGCSARHGVEPVLVPAATESPSATKPHALRSGNTIDVLPPFAGG